MTNGLGVIAVCSRAGCNKQFERIGNTRYCSKECAREARSQKQRERRKRLAVAGPFGSPRSPKASPPLILLRDEGSPPPRPLRRSARLAERAGLTDPLTPPLPPQALLAGGVAAGAGARRPQPLQPVPVGSEEEDAGAGAAATFSVSSVAPAAAAAAGAGAGAREQALRGRVVELACVADAKSTGAGGAGVVLQALQMVLSSMLACDEDLQCQLKDGLREMCRESSQLILLANIF